MGGTTASKKIGGDFSTSIEVKKGEITAHTTSQIRGQKEGEEGEEAVMAGEAGEGGRQRTRIQLTQRDFGFLFRTARTAHVHGCSLLINIKT